MNDDEGSVRLGKKSSEKGVAISGEVDYRTKAGTAWSHNFLNQKPWHPLSYPNQRRKWIAEQTHADKQRRAEEVAREFAQVQEYFRQTTLLSRKREGARWISSTPSLLLQSITSPFETTMYSGVFILFSKSRSV